MINVPKWLLELLEEDDFTCPNCNSIFSKNGLKACGVRLSFRNPNTEVIYLEYCCSDCKNSTILELYESGLENFAMAILNDGDEEIDTGTKENSGKGKPAMNKNDTKKNKNEKSQSKISQKEVDSLKKLLNESETHYDFLEALGVDLSKEIKETN